MQSLGSDHRSPAASGLLNRRNDSSPAGPPVMVPALLFFCIILSSPAWGRPSLCDDPWTYRIGTVDRRFNLSPQETHEVIQKACDIWKKAYSCDFFREDPGEGTIVINFIYDQRQDRLDTYRALDSEVESSKKTRKDLAAILDAKKSELENKKRALADDNKAYDERYEMLDVRTRLARMQTTVSLKEKQYLENEASTLKSLWKELESRRQGLKDDEAQIQSLVETIRKIDRDAGQYRSMKESMNEPIKAGVYVRYNRKRTINIYICPEKKRLIRMLAHELGHALGLGHSDDPKSLMYPINASESLEITFNDREALKKLFRGFD